VLLDERTPQIRIRERCLLHSATLEFRRQGEEAVSRGRVDRSRLKQLASKEIVLVAPLEEDGHIVIARQAPIFWQRDSGCGSKHSEFGSVLGRAEDERDVIEWAISRVVVYREKPSLFADPMV
jgi:hypothetical protein